MEKKEIMEKLSNTQRLENLKKFWQQCEYKNRIPDFCGIWISDYDYASFDEQIRIAKSPIIGYLQAQEKHHGYNEKVYIGFDFLGLSEFEDPFLEGFHPMYDSFQQTYDFDGKSCEDAEGECIQYHKQKKMTFSFKKKFSDVIHLELPFYHIIFGDWEGLRAKTLGSFVIIKNDDSDQYKHLALYTKDVILQKYGIKELNYGFLISGIIFFVLIFDNIFNTIQYISFKKIVFNFLFIF